MIKITVNYAGELIKEVLITGHAGYADKGADIYCAGVSAVAQTALAGLLHHLEQAPFYKISDGHFECKLADNLNDMDNEKAQIILSTMKVGLLAMQDVYKEHMKIIIRRQNDV